MRRKWVRCSASGAAVPSPSRPRRGQTEGRFVASIIRRPIGHQRDLPGRAAGRRWADRGKSHMAPCGVRWRVFRLRAGKGSCRPPGRTGGLRRGCCRSRTLGIRPTGLIKRVPSHPIAGQCAPCCQGGLSHAAGPGGAVRLREAFASLGPSGGSIFAGGPLGPEGVCWSRRAYRV
jgi:hypothetical protein